MLTLIGIAVGALIFAGSFWLSIRIIDGHNSANTFGMALFVGVLVAGFGGMAGPVYGLIPLVGLAYLMMQYYDIGLIKTVLILAACSLLQELGGWLFEAIVPA